MEKAKIEESAKQELLKKQREEAEKQEILKKQREKEQLIRKTMNELNLNSANWRWVKDIYESPWGLYKIFGLTASAQHKPDIDDINNAYKKSTSEIGQMRDDFLKEVQAYRLKALNYLSNEPQKIKYDKSGYLPW